MQREPRAPLRGDGDGFVRCADGQRRWGRFGAAGLLLRAPGPDGAPLVLLQHRAWWTHQGGLWGLPGGARDSAETAAEAALREAAEETGLDPAAVRVRAERVAHPGGDDWSYTTVVADAAAPLETVANQESAELRWLPEADVPRRRLHPGLGAAWPALAAREVALVVDAANVVGSVPDGWWRDRAGAAHRLLIRLAAALPGTVELPDGAFGWARSPVAVLEGRARDAADVPGVRVVRAAGSGDDAVVDEARAAGPGAVVVTADRGLRARLPAGTAVLGPSALLAALG